MELESYLRQPTCKNGLIRHWTVETDGQAKWLADLGIPHSVHLKERNITCVVILNIYIGLMGLVIVHVVFNHISHINLDSMLNRIAYASPSRFRNRVFLP